MDSPKHFSSVTHVNKPYLVWFKYWSLINQHYEHRTNQKLRLWANTVFGIVGLVGKCFLGSVVVQFWFFPSATLQCYHTLLFYNVQNIKQRKVKIRPSTKILNPKIIENIVVVSVYRLLASSAILWL